MFASLYFSPFWFLLVKTASITLICGIWPFQVMAIIADFMLVWLPAPTVSLRPSLAIGAGPLIKFFYNCPDNAFQVFIKILEYVKESWHSVQHVWSWYTVTFYIFTGSIGWYILFIFAENRCYSGMYLIVLQYMFLSFQFNEAQITLVFPAEKWSQTVCSWHWCIFGKQRLH